MHIYQKSFWRRISLLFCLTILPVFGIFAQRFEFGAGVGMLQYRGDLQPGYLPKRPSLAAELIGRYNLSMAAVIRANLLVSPSVSASSVNSSDPYTQGLMPAAEFSGFLGELGVLGEYNFFNYRNPKNRYVFGSPYLFGGPAVFYTRRGPLDNLVADTLFDLHNSYFVTRPEGLQTIISPVFVLGVGYKQQLGQYFNLGIQASGRFLLAGGDKFDQVSDREITKVAVLDADGNFVPNPGGGFQYTEKPGVQLGNKADRDSYFYIGFSLTYTIKEVICPFKYEKKTEK